MASALGLTGCVAAGDDEPADREPVWDSGELGDDDALTWDLSTSNVTVVGGKLFAFDNRDLYIMDTAKRPGSWKFEDLKLDHGAYFLGEEEIVGLRGDFSPSDSRFTVYEPDDGEPRFSYPSEADAGTVEVLASTVVKDVAVVAIKATKADGHEAATELVGIGLKDGEELWREPVDADPDEVDLAAPVPDNEANMSTSDWPLRLRELRPLVDSPVVYLDTVEDDVTVAVDVETGKSRWTLIDQVDDLANAPITLLDDGLIVSIDPEDTAGDVLEADVADSKDDTTSTVTTYKEEGSVRYTAVPMNGGRLLGQTPSRQPELIDLSSGERVWTSDKRGTPLIYLDSTVVQITGGDEFRPKGEVVSVDGDGDSWSFGTDPDESFTPKFLDERVLIAKVGATTVACDRETGKKLWQASGTPGNVYATDDHYFVGDREGLRAFEKK